MTTDHSRKSDKADSKKNCVDNHNFKFPLFLYFNDLFEVLSLLFLCLKYNLRYCTDTSQESQIQTGDESFLMDCFHVLEYNRSVECVKENYRDSVTVISIRLVRAC